MMNSRAAALDGLRGLAVLFVILFHYWHNLPTGGFVGVDIFFVLSGYLITTLLLDELEAGSYRFSSFFLRRTIRLAPALWAMALGTTVIVAALSIPPHELPGDLAFVLTYTSNWKRAFIERFGDSFYFCHTWSLAVEQQFYLSWPLLFAAGATRLSRSDLLKAILMGVAVVTLWRWLVLYDGARMFRIYHGFDTRIDELLVGCALAVALSMPRLRAALVEWLRTRPTLSATLLAAMPILGAYTDIDGVALAIFGYTLLAVISAIVVIDCRFNPASLSARILSNRPLAYLGAISYGVYLWHLPILALFIASGSEFGLAQKGVAFLLTVAIASASHRLLEQPLLRWNAERRSRERAAAPRHPHPASGALA
ncbi:hypothetical protein MSC49_19770 [Methylosinus sp. C49]|uniref:acyltransferase family protein n=1 Tax=Methylosinus sp. C49 TaxID=2699395 RepID=UPI0013671C1C|nr:acyltransferase [Methylosinus sp. C49]BBU62042.1 hypothetical protein MSC49_19770 [Methylosinus sp. C49]